MTGRLDDTERPALLASLPDWACDPAGTALTREFRFADFQAAFGFMTRVALWAERHDHHPQWSNVYQRVTVTWSSHDVQGLSMRDIDAARHCDLLWAAQGFRPPSA
ncbi:pterin-4-alpha-carbinolamine dehydratase [Sphaerotilus hippei]|uniref:Putative pterin-4-alpha-carbinolamine dehydratase n=1 Tax=Sphaerotilus hippei TaxID=744406 RepID=A0A318GUG5_9BURK|nr:4a-hydroxytetrahydrobiopterin dehydratase [Sphaerotilus hippei]PXW92344.1 pterin-4-alpha-carbinolamine dehydratase [Sphaerotilus hippei]